jgi:TRAP-type C4-dicarboxylate transport system permease large subunit
MQKINLPSALLILVALAVSLSSCQAIADIFKAGVWVGVIVVVAVIALIFWLVSKASGKK